MADTSQPQEAAPQQMPEPAKMPQEASPQYNAEEDEKFFSALGYFGPLFIIPLIVKPKSPYCKFHAKQSMVLFLIFIVVLVILAAIPWFGSIFTLVLFALYVLAIYRAYKGDMWNIPFVSNFAGKMNVEMLYNKAGLAVSGISGLKEKAENLAEKAGEATKDLGKQEETKTPPPPAPPPPPTQA